MRFISRGKLYEIKPDSYFMDNDSCIQFIRDDSLLMSDSVLVPKKEWKRLMPLLKMSYRNYGYGQIVKIFRLPQNQ